MASKESFTEDEWKVLQWAVMDAGSHITASDYPGLLKSFKEAAGGSRYLTGLQSSDNALVRDLARDQARVRDPRTENRADLASDAVLDRIREAVALVEAKDPADVEDFKYMILGLAKMVAQEVDGTSEGEAEAVTRIEDALGLS